jgi:hypothetical protein
MPRPRKPFRPNTAFGGPRNGRAVMFSAARRLQSGRPRPVATRVGPRNPGKKINVPSRTPTSVRQPSGRPFSGSPSITASPGSRVAATDTPAPVSKPDFRMKRSKQLHKRLSELRGGDTGPKQAKRGKSVAKKLNIDSKINELRTIEDRSEKQESKLDTLKDRYAKEQARFAPPKAKAEFGDAKPVKDEPKAETSDRATFLARLRENRYQRVGKGRRKAVRRRPPRKGRVQVSSR